MTASDDWLESLLGPAYDWRGSTDAPATDEELAALAAFAGRPLPDDYLAYQRRFGGADLWYRDVWNIRIIPAREVPVWNLGYGFTPEAIPGALLFGADSGSEGLVFDLRPGRPDKAYPIYAVNFVTIDWNEAILIQPDFRSLLLSRHELFGPGNA